MKYPLAPLAVALLGMCWLTVSADEPAKGKPKVTILSEREITEQVDGKKSRATTVEVTLEPGQESLPHRHPGPVFGYVLEGEYQWAIDDQPVKTLKAGDTFYEPTMCLHRVSKNPSDKNRTRVLAVLLLPRDAKELSVPEPKKE
jgi:quercetin dioxygenase-like cupin family protein